MGLIYFPEESFRAAGCPEGDFLYLYFASDKMSLALVRILLITPRKKVINIFLS